MARVAREKISCHSNGGASRIAAVGFGGNSMQLAVRKATIEQLIIHTLRIVRSAESIYCFSGSVFPTSKLPLLMNTEPYLIQCVVFGPTSPSVRTGS